MISIQTYKPEKLSALIKSFWCLKVSDNLSGPHIEEIIPDGHHELIFSLDAAGFRKRIGQSTWHRDPSIYFAGQNKKSYIQHLNPGSIIYAVRFQPHTRALFYNFPAFYSTDNLISFSDVVSSDTITSCITESPAKTFANLEKEFLKKASHLTFTLDYKYVDSVVRKIIIHQGNLKISSLERTTGVSTRYLQKLFQQYIGVSPKQFCNIVRYIHFVTFRKEHQAMSLTQCAYETGFKDQSQLIYLSQLITGSSPKAYFTKPNHINNYFLND